MRKIAILIASICLLQKAHAQMQDINNVLVGINAPALGVNIKTNFPNHTGEWYRCFSISNNDLSTNFISLGAYGSCLNGATQQKFSFIGTDFSNPHMVFMPNKNVGVGTLNPRAVFDVGNLSPNALKTVLARLPEGDKEGEGTYLGVKSYDTQLSAGEACCNIKSFALEHKFYGLTNSSINFYRGESKLGGFITFSTSNNTERMRIDRLGNVLIAKTSQANPIYKLDVAGKVRADEITVNTSGADFVFEKEYNLRPLHEVEAFIKENRHLPDVAPAKTMQENGVSVGEMNAKLLQKIEELTLYLIEQKKEIEQLKQKLADKDTCK